MMKSASALMDSASPPDNDLELSVRTETSLSPQASLADESIAGEADLGPGRALQDPSEQIASIQAGLEQLQQCGPEKRKAQAQELRVRVTALADDETLAGNAHALRHASAVAALASLLCSQPEDINDSNLRAITAAGEVLDALLRDPDLSSEREPAPISVVLFDANSGTSSVARAVFENAGFRVEAFATPTATLEYLEGNAADIVVVNVPVPVPRGFDISRRIPKLPLHEQTPVLLTLSSTVAGSERMMVAELLVKALTLVYQQRLAAALPAAESLGGCDTISTELAPSGDDSHEASPAPDSQDQASDEEDLFPVPAPENQSATDPALADLQSQLEREAEARQALEIQLQEAVAAQASVRLEMEMLAAGRAENACREQESRLAYLAEELARERHTNDELNKKLVVEQQSAKEAWQRARELQEQTLPPEDAPGGRWEEQLASVSAELSAAKAAAEKEAAERERVTRELTGQLKRAEARLQEERVQRERLVSQRPPGDVPPPDAPAAGEPETGFRLRREAVAALARTAADLQRERGDRQRAEERAAALAIQLQSLHRELSAHLESDQARQARVSALEKVLQEREHALDQIGSELESEGAERRRLEGQLRAAEEVAARYESSLGQLEETKRAFEETRNLMENRLEKALAELADSRACYEEECSQRQRLEGAVAAAQRMLKEQEEASRLEISKLRATRQLEEYEVKRREADAARSRQDLAKSAQAGAAALGALRRQIQEPVEDLRRAACALLQSELAEHQKKLAEDVLENTILLQANLQESSDPNSDRGSDS